MITNIMSLVAGFVLCCLVLKLTEFPKFIKNILAKICKWEYTGKVQLRRTDAKKLLLKNGNVLILGGLIQRDPTIPVGIVDDKMHTIPANILELYNPDTEMLQALSYLYILKIVFLY